MSRRLLAACIALAVAACGREPPGEAPVANVNPADSAAPAPGSAPAPPATPAVEAGYRLLDASVVGPTDTLEQVQARLGAGNAVADKVPGAEGTEFDGWVLYPGHPARRVYVYLDEGVFQPSMASVLDRESTWVRADGIRMGLDLAELERRNGAPVRFMGFDWDYGGGVVGWSGGALEKASNGPVELCPPEVTDYVDLEGYPSGEAEFDSGNAWVRAHPPTVCSFAVTLAEPPADPAP